MKAIYSAALASLALAGATHVHAREASPGHTYGVQMKLVMHGQDSSPLLTVQEDKPFALAGESAGKPWRVEFIVKRTGQPGVVRVAGKILEAGTTLSEPVLIGKLGDRMGVKVGDDLQMSLVVNELAP